MALTRCTHHARRPQTAMIAAAVQTNRPNIAVIGAKPASSRNESPNTDMADGTLAARTTSLPDG